IADARAAKKALDAAQKSVDALQLSYENTEKRFKVGAVNTFEFTTAKNNLDQAQINLIVAKYDYLFRLKVVDFYEGKKITLD
ncbi:MAG: TolC family protein, partial [Bacteroidota bacterium]